MEGERNDDEKEHREAFGEHTNIRQECREEINQIKNNDPGLKWWDLEDDDDAENFSDLAWERLGRYIADNIHLIHLDLNDIQLTDAKMSLLFKKITRPSSLKNLHISGNDFGLSGIQNVVPLLKNARGLTELNISFNVKIKTEGFGMLVNALHGGSIENLDVCNCGIDDITALEHCMLPYLRHLNLTGNFVRIIPSLEKYTNLEELYLEHNIIGKVGCRSIAKLLRNESSSLRHLNLGVNHIGENGAEMLAHSLKHNTKLVDLTLYGNRFKEKGCRALLKLLNDVSSIERTYNSNHTLETLDLPRLKDSKFAELEKHIASAMRINRKNGGNPHATGQAKVIETQLKSSTRMQLSQLQGIDCYYSSLFADIDPALLPDIIALAGAMHGQNEIYCMLVATVPDLASIVNKKAALTERLAENAAKIDALNAAQPIQVAAIRADCTRQVAALRAESIRKTAALCAKNIRKTATLNAKNSEIKKELESIAIESGGGKQCKVNETYSSNAMLCGKKRGRSDK